MNRRSLSPLPLWRFRALQAGLLGLALLVLPHIFTHTHLEETEHAATIVARTVLAGPERSAAECSVETVCLACLIYASFQATPTAIIEPRIQAAARHELPLATTDVPNFARNFLPPICGPPAIA